MTQNPQQVIILDSGCEAQVCNPFEQYKFHSDGNGLACGDFALKTPPLPLTKEYKHLAGKKVMVVEVKQVKQGDKWFNVTSDLIFNNIEQLETRKAFEVIEEESKPSNSVEEAAEKAKQHYGSDKNLYAQQRDGFVDGYTIRNDEVVKMIEDRIAELNSVDPFDLSDNAFARNDGEKRGLTTLLQTIKG